MRRAREKGNPKYIKHSIHVLCTQQFEKKAEERRKKYINGEKWEPEIAQRWIV